MSIDIRTVNSFILYANSGESKNFKKALKSLEDILANPKCFEEITKNSTWPAFFKAVHRMVLYEAALFNTPSCNQGLKNRTMDAAMITSVKHANLYIERTAMLSAIKEILSNDRYSYYRNTYLTILNDYFLIQPIDMKTPTYTEWKETLNVLTLCYDKSTSQRQKYLILCIMKDVVENGCTSTMLSLEIKAIIGFVGKVLKDIYANEYTDLLSRLLEVAYVIYLQISSQHLLSLCAYGEKFLPDLINMKESKEKYKILLLFVQIYGKNESILRKFEKSFNIQNWRMFIADIYSKVLFHPERTISSDLVDLGCEVYRLALLDPTIIEGKVTSNTSFCFAQIITKCKEDDNLFMLRLLKALLKKYPEFLKTEDFVSLLETVKDNFIEHFRNRCIFIELCEIVTILVMHQIDCSKFTDEAVKIDRIWMVICTVILRGITIYKVEEANYKVLSYLITEESHSNMSKFLNTFVLKLTITSPINAEILQMFCKDHLWKDIENSNAKRQQLLHQVLNINWKQLSFCIPVNKISYILTFLVGGCTSIFDPVIFDEDKIGSVCDFIPAIFHESKSLSVNEVAKYHDSLTSVLSIFQDYIQPKSPKKSSTERLTESINEQNKLLLINNIVELATEVSNTQKEESISVTILQIVYLLQITSDLRKARIIDENQILILRDLIKESLSKIVTKLSELNVLELDFDELMNILESLFLLYSKSYDRESVQWIVSVTTMSMLKHIFLLPKTFHESLNSLVMLNSHIAHRHICQRKHSAIRLTKREVLKACTVRILTAFCRLMLRRDEPPDGFAVVLNILLSGKWIDEKSTTDIQIATKMLLELTDLNLSNHCADYLPNLVKLMMVLYCKMHSNISVSICLLKVMPRLIRLATSLSKSHSPIVENISILFYNYYRMMSDKNCGLLLGLEFMNSLRKIIELDDPKALAILKRDQSTVLFDVLLSCLTSAYYPVRLEAARCVYIIFSLNNAMDEHWKMSFIEEILKDSWLQIILNDKGKKARNAFEQMDFVMSRAASAASTLAAVICNGNEMMQSQALLIFCRLKVGINLSAVNARRIINEITESRLELKYVLENSLSYLIISWLSANLGLNTFPWDLLGFSSPKDFYRSHIQTLISLLINDTAYRQHIPEFFQVLELTFTQVFELTLVPIVAFLFGNPNDDYARDLLMKLKSNDELQLPKPFKVMLREHFHEIVVYTISRLSDAMHFQQSFQVNPDELPNEKLLDPPQFSVTQVSNIVRSLEVELGLNSDSLLNELVAKCPDKLQRILAYFTLQLNDKKATKRWRLRVLHQYFHLCQMIGQQLNMSYFNDFAPYVIRDISYTLAHMMTDKNADAILAKVIAVCLYAFLRNALPVRAELLQEHLNIYVLCLCRLYRYTGSNCETVLRTVQLIFLESQNLFDQLPVYVNRLTEPVREALNIPISDCSLRLIIEQFLKDNLIHENRNVDDPFVIDSLQFLKDQLSNRKGELQILQTDLQTLSGFTEECATSLIHQLIHRLVKYSKSSLPETRLTAISCLGVLGLSDLRTMTLYPDQLIIQEVVDPSTVLTHQFVSLLIHLLVHNDVNLRNASYQALYDLLASAQDDWIKQLPSVRKLRDLEVALTKKKHNWHRNKVEYKLPAELIHPFIYAPKSTASSFQVNDHEFNQITDPQHQLWIGNMEHQDWTRMISCGLARCLPESYLPKLIPVFELSTTFCTQTLPRIIYTIVRNDPTKIRKLSIAIDTFFHHHQQSKFQTKQTIQCVLNVVNYFRVQNNKDTDLSVNYLKIARSALACNATFTAALFVEIWSIAFLDANPLTDWNLPILDHVSRIDDESGKLVHDTLREMYGSIGLPDIIYYCSSLHCRDRSSLSRFYMDTEQWDKVLIMKDAELHWQQMHGNSLSADVTKDLFNAMHHLDLHQLIVSMQNLTFNKQSHVSDYAYESAWRLSNWNLMPTEQTLKRIDEHCNDLSLMHVSEYALYHYKAMKCLHESKLEELKVAVNEARERVVNNLYNVNFESATSIKLYLSQVQMLEEIEEVSKRNSENGILKLYSDWRNQTSLDNIEYLYAEPILHQRFVVLQMQNSLRDAVSTTCLNLLDLAKQNGHARVMLLLLDDLKKLRDTSETMKFELEFQKANIIWSGEKSEHGRRSLQNLLRDDKIPVRFRARCLEACATWAAEAQTEHPQDITNTYEAALQTFQRAANFDETDTKTLLTARLNMARFVDKEYLKLSDQMKSTYFKVLKRGVQSLPDIAPHDEKNAEIRIAKHYKKRNLQKDAMELENIEQQKNNYLLLAVESYALNLQQSDSYDNVVFRLVALWLSNINNANLAEVIRKYVQTIPSYKFLPLIPQLIPRLDSTINHFAQNVKLLISRCAKEHPYHTLPALLAMKHQYEDTKYGESSTRMNQNADPKTTHAANLVDDLMTDIGDIIRETETLSMALIMLAYWKVKVSGSEITIPRTQELMKVRNFRYVAVPTLNIQIRPNARYDDVVTVVEYKKTFSYVGGVNAPKKISCLGSDGHWRPQLLKGQDDMKQDAIMQQIFSVMNILLNANEDARKNKLKIRTYKIVPLSQRSGIIEWCANTIPLVIILMGNDGKSGVHKKYYPKDFTAKQCRAKMEEVAQSSEKTKYQAYIKICQQFHPAFQHYFVETYQTPEIWFERKLNYTRSVAVSSIIGYILGIGDRHPSNILFDERTAEVVHIDFGYAFEQGKVLSVPEVVPFRLTRDIEAAMGVYGAQGLMKHTCVQTMRVLRQNEETILMLLEVLLYDPIYLWSALPSKSANKKSDSICSTKDSNQDVSASQKNTLAKKALWLIQQKLQGIEQCIQVDVTCQVQRIIQEARDPHNLSRMYFGWQPYL